MAAVRREAGRLPTSINLVHAVLPAWDQEDREEPASITYDFDRQCIPSGPRLIALVSRDRQTYSSLAVLRKSSITSTFQQRLRFEQRVPINPIEFRQIQTNLPPRFRRFFADHTQSDLARLPQGTANAVSEELAQRDPTFDQILRQMVKRIARRPMDLEHRPNTWRIMAWEKDAVDTVLSFAKMKHTTLTDDQWDELRKPTPILELLGRNNALEDRQIEQDASAFGNLRLLNADVRGRTFFDERSGTRVTVINANRGPLERTLGVDLLIHYERFSSYLLIQYKRLTREEDATGTREWRFRPSGDRNFAKEVRRIMEVRKSVIGLPVHGPSDYRLSDDPFFFKFCRADSFKPDQTGMTRGLYILAVDADHFLKSNHAKGPRGGAYLGFDNLPRRLPNSLFLELAREGWIGSRALGSEEIVNVLASSLDASNSVMMANIVGRSVTEMKEADANE